ncbi:sugar transferase [Rivibacter subsaxonicus]|uniref:Lipopolysaccharide/colanic/teichoic acid biosynthesis glycosyltransferase n=1 Tax=Rivibacter subsaxonicus TaxID=457575 RepID=A0A4Q7VWC9_9BURK|nr:sugar transferase [Rivibacter subsaxonicus]RZU00795.1 lipopolysaccharide/colanic/teichoic acid biosynthesis glycosyltransferase [Rivibacter subsaxonicus]
MSYVAADESSRPTVDRADPESAARVVAFPSGAASPLGRGQTSTSDSAARHRRASDAPLAADGAPIDSNDDHSRSDFFATLLATVRHSERTGAPLAIAVFSIDPEKHNSIGAANRLLKLLHMAKRDSDVLGYLDSERAAVLLVDTDLCGAQRFTQRVGRRAADLGRSAVSAVYPDALFDQVIRDCREVGERSTLPPYIYRGPDAFGYPLKRSLDVIGAALALVLLSPLMLLTALAVKLSSPGPVIFRQTRLGKGGVPFEFLKFRSMFVANDDAAHRAYVARLIAGEHEPGQQGDGPLYKIGADPRITAVGNVIRKTSIDELPQLWNVLKGDMSLVGPRPPLNYEVERYRAWHLRRTLDAQPGITGVWQVSGRSNVSFDEMVRMDLRYIRHCSLKMDLKILAKTVIVVLRGDGAS